MSLQSVVPLALALDDLGTDFVHRPLEGFVHFIKRHTLLRTGFEDCSRCCEGVQSDVLRSMDLIAAREEI